MEQKLGFSGELQTTASAQTLLIDTTAPTITTTVLTAATDSGSSHSDGITNVNKPTIIGTIDGTGSAETVQVTITGTNGATAYTHPH